MTFLLLSEKFWPHNSSIVKIWPQIEKSTILVTYVSVCGMNSNAWTILSSDRNFNLKTSLQEKNVFIIQSTHALSTRLIADWKDFGRMCMWFVGKLPVMTPTSEEGGHGNADAARGEGAKKSENFAVINNGSSLAKSKQTDILSVADPPSRQLSPLPWLV